jgi:hypothetical protein
MSKMSKPSKMFKTLRILNPLDPEGNLMSPGEIKAVFNNAFGCDAVQGIRRNLQGTTAGTTTVSIKQDQDLEYQNLEYWTAFYAALKKKSCVYIDSLHVTDELTHSHIEFSTEPAEGHWQVRLAEKTKVADFGSCAKPDNTVNDVSVSEPATKVADIGPAELPKNDVDDPEYVSDFEDDE